MSPVPELLLPSAGQNTITEKMSQGRYDDTEALIAAVPTSPTSTPSRLPWEIEDWEFDDDIGVRAEADDSDDSDVGGDELVPPANALFIVKAAVTGFVGEKPGASDADIAYVVNVLWSDGRNHVVKRTFSDFCTFHYCLVEEYARSCTDIASDESPLTLGLYLPERQNAAQDSIVLAEHRELQLHKYVQELIKLPPGVSMSPTVLTFFESRNSDPKPYKDPSTNVSEKNDPEELTLCWV